jgi:carbonic anhydrase
MKHIPRTLRVTTGILLLVFGAPSHSLSQTTQAQQQSMTPQAVLDDLMEGNQRFINGTLTLQEVNVVASREATASGQYPKAVILSCLDSRVPVEVVFDQNIGDIFVGRVAGNVENEDQLGSMEFATRVAGAKLVMVLGHSHCGAIKGACDDVKLGNLTLLLEKIKPAVKAVEGFKTSERTSSNAEFVARVVEENVRQTVTDIRQQSEILNELESDGKIMIVGAVYDLESGEVALLDK